MLLKSILNVLSSACLLKNHGFMTKEIILLTQNLHFNTIRYLSKYNFACSKLSYRLQIFKHNCGGSIGNLVFVWIVPDGLLDQTRQFNCVSKVKKQIPTFESRMSASLFRSKYMKITGLTLVVRRSF